MGDRLVMGCELFCGYGKGVAVVTSKNKKERKSKRQELQQDYRYVIEIGDSNNKLPPEFDHLQAIADVIHFYHQREDEVVEIVILGDLLTPSGWDMIKLLFPNRELSSDDQGNMVIIKDESLPSLWRPHFVELRQQQAIEPTAST